MDAYRVLNDELRFLLTVAGTACLLAGTMAADMLRIWG